MDRDRSGCALHRSDVIVDQTNLLGRLAYGAEPLDEVVFIRPFTGVALIEHPESPK